MLYNNIVVGDNLKKNRLLIKLINLIVKFRYIFLIIIIILTILSGLNNKTNNILDNKKTNEINKIEILIENINNEDTINIENNINNLDYVKNIITDYKDNNALLILYIDKTNTIKKDINNIILNYNYILYDNNHIVEDNNNYYIIISIIIVILLILLLTTQSYFDILLGLFISIISIILNIGININNTNLLLVIIELSILLYYYLIFMNYYHKEIDDSKSKINALKKTLSIILPKMISNSIIMILPIIPIYLIKLNIRNINNIIITMIIYNIIVIVFLLPSLLTIFNNIILKLRHRNILIDKSKLINIIINGRKIIITIFFLISIVSLFIIPKYNYIYNEKSINNNIETLNKINNVSIIIKNDNKDYNKQLEIANKLLHDKKILSVTNIGNIKLEDNLYLGSNINYHDFSNYFNTDIDTSKSIYQMYAEESDELIKLNDIDNYEIPITNLIEFLYNKDINELTNNKVNTYYKILDNYKELLENNNNSKFIIEYYGDIESKDTYKLLDTIKDDINKTYDNISLQGESINTKNIKELFNQNKFKINIIIIIIILLLLLFITKSIGLSILLTTIIESNIIINFSLITLINNSIFYISYIIIKILEIIFMINNLVNISNKYLNLRKKYTKKTSLIKILNETYSPILFSIIPIILLNIVLMITLNNNVLLITSLYIVIGFIISLIILILVIPSILYTYDKSILNTKIKK